MIFADFLKFLELAIFAKFDHRELSNQQTKGAIKLLCLFKNLSQYYKHQNYTQKTFWLALTDICNTVIRALSEFSTTATWINNEIENRYLSRSMASNHVFD